MSAAELDRTKVTFSQAEGIEPLPQPLQLGEVSHDLRSKVWRVFEDFMRKDHHWREQNWTEYEWIDGKWKEIIRDIWVNGGEVPHSYSDEWAFNANIISQKIFETAWNKFFDFILFVMRHRQCPEGLIATIGEAFVDAQAAYEVIEPGPIILPRTTPEEGIAVRNVLKALEHDKLRGARTHLRLSCDKLNVGEYAASIRESVHAVEAVARTLDPEASKTLAPALAALERKIQIHRALKQAFLNIYGYTSDEEGIRHSLLNEESASVDLTDATFMFGACASFVSYLLNKARSAGLLSD